MARVEGVDLKLTACGFTEQPHKSASVDCAAGDEVGQSPDAGASGHGRQHREVFDDVGRPEFDQLDGAVVQRAFSS